jgi:hypothetical protein
MQSNSSSEQQQRRYRTMVTPTKEEVDWWFDNHPDLVELNRWLDEMY